MDILAGICHVCGRYVSQAEFDERRAVVLLKRRYCRHCTHAITGGASASTATSSKFLLTRQIAALFSGRRPV